MEAQRGPAVFRCRVRDRERAPGQESPREDGLGEARRERARVEEGVVFFLLFLVQFRFRFRFGFGRLFSRFFALAVAAASEEGAPEGGPGDRSEEERRRRSGGGVFGLSRKRPAEERSSLDI